MPDTDKPGVPEGDAGLVRLRLDLAYDGTDFAGWARQPGLRTVQGELESALATVLRLPQPPQLTVAGRTDAGVHARGQVAHLDVPADHCDHCDDGEVRRLNGVLPPDVRLRHIAIAPPGFDARFSALSRRYSYRVSDRCADPLRRRDTLTHKRALDVEAMNTASALLVGEHDFAAFCRKREGASTIRALLAFDWTRDAEGIAIARVEADAFCHSMVRALIGALLPVGDGRRPPAWPRAVLTGQVRDPAVSVVAAYGLTLEEVRYPDDDELAARAALTRNRRDAPASG